MIRIKQTNKEAVQTHITSDSRTEQIIDQNTYNKYLNRLSRNKQLKQNKLCTAGVVRQTSKQVFETDNLSR